MIGRTISHYRIIEKLGQGGMGEVYLAEDLSLERRVAIKFLPQHLTRDKDTIERFKREAKATAALNHPNIVTIYEIVETDKDIYIVMEYVDGQSLREFIEASGERKPPETGSVVTRAIQIIDIIQKIAAGLSAAHKNGIVHRDIKPENIIITERDEVKILDFGLAKLKGVSHLTEETSTLGTIAYMSPEQLSGQDVDQRSDIWSVGILLYEMLSGKRPFNDDYEQAVIYSVLNDEPQMPVTVDPPLKSIIITCLRKDPEQRYQQIEELITDLIKINKQGTVTQWFKKPLVKMLIPVILVIIIIIGYFIMHESTSIEILSADDSWQHSIAVLPFADMSSDQDQEFFCDGMAEEIINALTNVGRLRVIARTSAFAFKGKNMDVRDIGKQLDVETLLEGSVRKSGERLRVTTQLVRTADGAHLWSKQYDRNLTDIFAIQEEIALVIVNQLKIKLLGNEEQRVTRRLTKNLEAYHHYLRGRHILNRRKATDIHKAITYFQKSLELDSLYMMGYVGLADAYALLPSYANTPSEKAYTRSKEAISRALEINNQVGEAYASLGWIRMLADWDWTGAEQAFQRGMELNPGYATLNHWYGYLYMMLRKFDQALIKVQRALELDPLSPVINRVVGDVYFNSGQYDQAIPVLKKCLELEPCLPFAHLQLSGCYSRKSLFQEALTEIQNEKDCRGNYSTGVDFYVGLIYARMGEMERSQQVLARLEKLGVKSTGLARLYFALGKKDKGYQMLENLYRNHNTWVIYINCHPDFDQVRHDARFQDLLKKIGFKS